MNRLTQFAIWGGGGALLAATAIDTIAVAGRHVGMPVAGSIEMMQAAVLIAGSIGLVIATLDRVHARVRLLSDRLSPLWRDRAERLSDLITLLFVLALLAGSVWLATDLWNGYEQSELLGVPWAALRAIANICLLVVAGIVAWRVVARRPD